MAKCSFCKTKKGKRYCSPIENILCPLCCGKNRLTKIGCIEECRYLEGVEFQKKREEEKAFSTLMASVPHEEHDDLFYDTGVTFMAGEMETFVRDVYINDIFHITDQTVYESYKTIYQIHFNNQQVDEDNIDGFTKELLKLYEDSVDTWASNLKQDIIGQVLLRLMISIKKMSGEIMGDFGYLNYLKNNFGKVSEGSQFIVEDKFGNKTTTHL